MSSHPGNAKMIAGEHTIADSGRYMGGFRFGCVAIETATAVKSTR